MPKRARSRVKTELSAKHSRILKVELSKEAEAHRGAATKAKRAGDYTEAKEIFTKEVEVAPASARGW